MPLSGRASTWGDEVYVATPLCCRREPGARSVLEPWKSAYWTDGDAIAIGYGPTPMSHDEEIRLASPFNV